MQCIKDPQKELKKMKKVLNTSDPIKKSEMVNTGTNAPQRHEGFQFNTNPMNTTEFEKNLVAKEAIDRHVAKLKYTAGIQGVDGGKYCREHREY
jgi:hypothetical protein